MKLSRHHLATFLEPDLTPMIDVTFQLIAFFMFTISFSEAEQDQRVRLPASELAQPPAAPYEHPLTIHLTADEQFAFAGATYPELEGLQSALLREKQIVERYADRKLANATIIVRADEDARAGLVQQVIRTAQELGYERFALRGRQAEARRVSPPTSP